VNCGTISAGLAESELFGHRRGAFTGADRDRKGLVRSAHGGILFLDEIGELEDGLQSKLLRMLQEKTVLGVGEDGETSVDVRVIAATNRPLEQMVSEKNFREDLFYRLNVLSIHTPSLRERPGDIRPLVDYFFEKYRALAPALPPSIEDEFIEALAEAGLPGNVRQLENIVRQALVKKDDNAPLTLADLPPEILQQLSRWRPALRDESDGLPRSVDDRPQASSSQREVTSSVVRLLDGNNWRLNRSLASCEKLFLEAALHKTRGNQSQTARLLGITSRSVYNKVRKYHLNSTVNR
jgi:transcriptional regulator with PAS, ATPase and Fis domain